MKALLHRRFFAGAIARGVPAACLVWAVLEVACGQRREPAAQPRETGALPAARPETPPPPPDDRAVYVRACPLSGLRSGTVKIESDHRVSLLDGARTVATGETEDDFHARNVEASCAKRAISLQLDSPHEFREVTLVWRRRELIETSSTHQRQ
jgi:hypothetical protein